MPTGRRNSGGDDYYTSQWIFNGLGLEFDLDPCSPIVGGVVPAKTKYNIEDDGLSKDWFGLVWMNPPYSKPTPWVDRFLAHSNGVALVPFTNGRWWFNLWNHADAIMPIAYNHKFDRADGSRKTITFNTALYALGEVGVAAINRFKLHRIR